MVTQGQYYITSKKITLPVKKLHYQIWQKKSIVPVLEGALPVMQISRFDNQQKYETPQLELKS